MPKRKNGEKLLKDKEREEVLRACFDKWRAQQAIVDKLEAACAIERDKLSEIISEIYWKCGSGPYSIEVNGKMEDMIATKRKSSNGKETYYLRGVNGKPPEIINV